MLPLSEQFPLIFEASKLFSNPSSHYFLIRKSGENNESDSYTIFIVFSVTGVFYIPILSIVFLQLAIVEPQKIFDPPMSDSTFSTKFSAMLTWQYPGGNVDYYVIEYVLAQDSEGFASRYATINTVNGSQLSVAVGNLVSGAIYKFRVAVVNSRGTSPFSECGVFQTLGKSMNSRALPQLNFESFIHH